jgi:hypothetical protein
MMKSSFAENLVRHNGLAVLGFREWAFLRGMLFDAEDGWWGSLKKRDRLHEGLDLCLYTDGQGRSHNLGSGAKIPVIYSGRVVKIDGDFLGKSIYVKHDFRDGSGNFLYSVYGHTNPRPDIDTKVAISEGEVVGTIAETRGKRIEPPPHLHVSLVWASESLPVADLTWTTISAREAVKPIDPLRFLALPYVLLG